MHGAVLAISCWVLLNYSTLCIYLCKLTPLLHTVTGSHRFEQMRVEAAHVQPCGQALQAQTQTP
jgi:hypothetical protein